MDLRSKLELWQQLNTLNQEARPSAIENRNQFFPGLLNHSHHNDYRDNRAVDSQGYNARLLKNLFNSSNFNLNLNNAAGMFFLYNQAQAYQQQRLMNQFSDERVNNVDVLQVSQHQENQKMPHQLYYNQNSLQQHLTEPIAPPPSKKNEYMYKGRKLESYYAFLNYQRLHDRELKKIRLEPAQEDINFLNKFGQKYQPFYIFEKPGIFNFAVLQQFPKLKSHPPHLSELEYDEMREDFARNGYEELLDVGNENEFPPLEAVPESVQTMLSQVFTTPLKTLDLNQPKVEVPNQEDSDNSKRKDRRGGKKKVYDFCVFCQNNKEPAVIYNSHILKDEYGKILCPKLRKYKCPICGAVGENAHTLHHCPHRPIVTLEDVAKRSRHRQRGKRISFTKRRCRN